MSSAYLDLLVGSDSTEHNLGKVLGGEHPETDATNHVVLLNQSQRVVFPARGGRGTSKYHYIEHLTMYVILGGKFYCKVTLSTVCWNLSCN